MRTIALLLISFACFFTACHSSRTKEITFYTVSLTSTADAEVASCIRIKPFFLETTHQECIKESWVNRKGTVIAIVWKTDAPNEEQKEKIILPLFKKFEIESKLIADTSRINELDASLKEAQRSGIRLLEKALWYKGMEIEKLSVEEAHAIADTATALAHKAGLISDDETASIKKEIEEYMKTELVKVKPHFETSELESEMKWKQKGYEIYVKYIGIDRAEKVRDLYIGYKHKMSEARRKSNSPKEEILQSEITCPKCGNKKTETMPTDVCVLKYTCEKCKADLTPKNGDCCIFCSYGSVKCPSKQG